MPPDTVYQQTPLTLVLPISFAPLCSACRYWPDDALRLFNQKAYFYFQLMLSRISIKDVEK